MEYFNSVAEKPFSQQAVAFLNAYWKEVGDQAEFIFSVAWEIMKYTEMESQGISLIHKYQEGKNLDFDMGIKFFEQLCKFWEEPTHNFFHYLGGWAKEHNGFQGEFTKSEPEMMTSIVRKKELKEKVDVNFDGRVSFIEYLLYQYREFANPADFCVRSMKAPDEHPEIRKARLALEEVNARIRAYEEHKAKLEKDAEQDGVKGLKAKNELAQLHSSPLWESLNKALITAEAAVRIATKKFRNASTTDESGAPTDGALWWMNRDLEVKKAKYGKKN